MGRQKNGAAEVNEILVFIGRTQIIGNFSISTTAGDGEENHETLILKS